MPMPPAHYLTLSLAELPQAPLLTGTSGEATPDAWARCLNAAGRWAVRPSSAAPWLVWPPAQAADAAAAAARCAAARGRAVVVLARESGDWTEGREIRLFTQASDAALQGPTRQSEARARRLRTEADKLEAFCMVVRAASQAPDHAAFSEVSRAAAAALRTRFGGGSITSAFAWLAGPAGQDALDSVLAGEVEPGGPLSVQQLVEAAAMAQEAERLRAQDAHPAFRSGA